MRRKLISLLVISVLLTLLTPLATSAQDFDPAFKAIDQIKRENANQIRIEVAGDSFSISLGDNVAGTQKLGTFPLGQWPAFIAEAVKHGLLEYRHGRGYYGDYVELTFLSPQNTKLSTGRQDLTLPRSFFNYMRAVKQFPAEPGKNGFAILIYDPHQSVPGRYQLVPALNELVRSNPAFKFKLLNEGQYEKDDRSIPFNGLDEEFKKLPAGSAGSDLRSTLVYALVERFLIDCPMAYRLIYDEKMPSVAIDDNPSLADEDRINNGKREEDSTGSLGDRVSAIENKVEEFLSNRRNVTPRRRAIRDELIKAIEEYSSALYGWKNTSRDIASDLQKAAALLARVVELAEKFHQVAPTARLQSEISSLKGQDPSKFQRALYQNYAKREAVMADQIIREAKFTSTNIPVAFLGYNHFYSITADLKGQGIGYVVLAPESPGLRDVSDTDKFKRFVSPTTRANYLKEAAQWNKGPVGLTVAEVASVISPFLSQGATKFQAERLSERAAFLRHTDLTVDYDKVAGAATANAGLTQARIEVEATSGDTHRPNVPPGAVAYFAPDSGANSARLVILEPGGEGWRGPSGQARYDMLRHVPLTHSSRYAEGNDVINFYEIPGGQLGATVYDPASGRIYIINGGPAAMGDMLTLRPNSKPDGSGNTLIRMLVVELEPKHERKLATDGE